MLDIIYVVALPKLERLYFEDIEPRNGLNTRAHKSDWVRARRTTNKWKQINKQPYTISILVTRIAVDSMVQK